MLPLTDIGNSDRLVKKYGNKIKFCNDTREWLIRDGKIWEIDRTNQIQDLARFTILSIRDEAKLFPESTEQIKKFAISSQNVNRLRAMIQIASSRTPVSTLKSEFDTQPCLLNCQSGVIKDILKIV